MGPAGSRSVRMRATAHVFLFNLLCAKANIEYTAGIPHEVIAACSSRGLSIEYSDPTSRQGRVLQLLKTHSESKELPFYIDFSSERIQRRCKQAASELVVRAVRSGLPPGALVYDFTAGLGRDSLLLAAAGLRVVMFERSSVLNLLLQDALERLHRTDPQLHSRLSLIHGDAAWCFPPGDAPDAVYLDPMYPSDEVGRRSNVKKETQMLHRILDDEGNDDGNNRLLFEKALVLAQQKVVVKRPIHCDPLLQSPPHTAIRGESCRSTHPLMSIGSTHRFDCYFTRRVST